MTIGTPSRREFLALSSLSLAGLAHPGRGRWQRLPVTSTAPVDTFVPELVSPDRLRGLAQVAVDAARHDGASYADVRISNLRRLFVAAGPLPDPSLELRVECTYGVRALVDGVWAFAYGVDFTPDAVAQAARSAVTTARGLKAYVMPRPAMAPRPAVQGEWSAPRGVDPFTVSPDEHARMMGAYRAATERVLDSGGARIEFSWTSESRVFASTEGALLTQHLSGVDPFVEVEGSYPDREPARLRVRGFSPATVGFEALCNPELQDRIKATTEEARGLASYPMGNAEVGRFAAVFDGITAGTVLSITLVPALEMDRVLGYEADGVGTSFLSPVNEILGHSLFSPQLSVIADRTVPRYGAAKWDDEGVPTDTFPVIQRGTVVDYFATRTAAAASESTVQARGTSVAVTPGHFPTGRATHVTVPADARGPSMADMIAGIPNGVLALTAREMNTNQQLAGGLLQPGLLFEIKQGRITRRLRGGVVQVRSKVLWGGIAAMGNETTVDAATSSTYETETQRTVSFQVPAVHFKSVDVIQLGRRLA